MNNVPWINNPYVWASFIGLVLFILFLDLFILGGRKAKTMTFKFALVLTCFWVGLACLFNLGLWAYLVKYCQLGLANQKAMEFFAGYLLEESLSIDNVFVFIIIFRFFSVKPEYQHKILFYGILGAIVLRFVFITAGIWFVNQFEWLFYIFGIILIYSAIKMVKASDEESNIANNKILIWIRKFLPITDQYHGDKFLVRQNKRWVFTPLFMVLVFIELSDIIFAVDSIPAIFGVTRDSFIIFTSNIFAILGLRSLYFVFEQIIDRFYYLKYGISVILAFIGLKMLLMDVAKIPVAFSLAFIALVIVMSIVSSMFRNPELN